MYLIFSVVFFWSFFTYAHLSERVSKNLSPFFPQQQHSTFFIFGNNAEVLKSYCYLERGQDLPSIDKELIPKQEGECEFIFDDKNTRCTIKIDFKNLQSKQKKLIEDLDKYIEQNVNKGYNLFERVIFFREYDDQLLESFVASLKENPLPYRVLVTEKSLREDTPQFFSKKIVLNIFKIFIENLSDSSQSCNFKE